MTHECCLIVIDGHLASWAAQVQLMCPFVNGCDEGKLQEDGMGGYEEAHHGSTKYDV